MGCLGNLHTHTYTHTHTHTQQCEDGAGRVEDAAFEARCDSSESGRGEGKTPPEPLGESHPTDALALAS